MIIPAKKQVGNIARQQEEKPKLRVAAYCRVSTDTEEQATSYEAQIAHYTEYIQKNPEWEFVSVYQLMSVFMCLHSYNDTASARLCLHEPSDIMALSQ